MYEYQAAGANNGTAAGFSGGGSNNGSRVPQTSLRT
jgi:hypothetical protein